MHGQPHKLSCMVKMTPFTIKLSSKQIRQTAKLMDKLQLDRSSVIRLAIARLAEEEAHRKPATSQPD